MNVHKLTFDDFYDYEFELIAIQTTLNPIRLAFSLNKELEILLEKGNSKVNFETNSGKISMDWMCYEDEHLHVDWSLITNQYEIESEVSFGIFESANMTLYLIPELSKIDFFLKIENTDGRFNTEEIIKKIKKINGVTTVYSIEPTQLKSINNLIF